MKQVTNSLLMYGRILLRFFVIAFFIVLLTGVIGGAVAYFGYHDQARPIVSWCPSCRD